MATMQRKIKESIFSDSTTTLVRIKSFSFLDMELLWSMPGTLKFKVHLKEN